MVRDAVDQPGGIIGGDLEPLRIFRDLIFGEPERDDRFGPLRDRPRQFTEAGTAPAPFPTRPCM